MRPLKLGGLLAASLILVGSACGSQPTQRIVRAADVSAIPAPRELAPDVATTTTTTTAAPVVTTLAPKAASRPRLTPRSSGFGGGWEALRQCENGGSYAKGSSPGFFGAYQFDRGTWYSNNVGGGEWGSATPAQQDAAAQHLYAQRGTQPWPVCGRHLR